MTKQLLIIGLIITSMIFAFLDWIVVSDTASKLCGTCSVSNYYPIRCACTSGQTIAKEIVPGTEK